jgi:hypothetical protein
LTIAHYELVGVVEEVWAKAEAFAVTLTADLPAGSTIAIEGPVDFATFIAESIRLNDENVVVGTAQSKVGIKAPEAVDLAKTGMRVFRVVSG